jgi:Na+/H+ antiporter NhaD/arsenite permease-like protein
MRPGPNVPAEFLLFAATLVGVAAFHRQALAIAALGLAAILAWTLLLGDFHGEPGLRGLAWHLQEEWVVLANLLGLLVGFGLLARHFELSGLPRWLPAILPDGWMAGVALLLLVFLLSAFLDNIAAAMIGATVAASVYRGQVQVGFLAAVVAAANAGGSGSVVGDTTTTMMWLAGISPLDLVRAYVAAGVAFLCLALPAAWAQHRATPVVKDADADVRIDWPRLVVAASILICAIAANIQANSLPEGRGGDFPYVGATVLGVILFLAPWRRPDWSVLPETIKGSLFLLCLVLAASLMPVDELPHPSVRTTLGLGFVSSVFDNIPLTKLALEQGGYDWALLAYAVGFGGSMLWFGSSAGVAVSNLFPQARSAVRWLREAWYVPVAYVAGFLAHLLLLGWAPDA